MKIAQVQIFSWGDHLLCDTLGKILEIGDEVIVEGVENEEFGRVLKIEEKETREGLPKILRKATSSDKKTYQYFQSRKKEAQQFCRHEIKKINLPMKLVDVHFSFDGGKITFAFIAEGRVDFRELVKRLARHFQKSIRLEQIGSRDEAKKRGDFGVCGRPLCCKNFLKKITAVTLDFARDQGLGQRGSERLSGMCGRLLCCLSYEENLYKELGQNLPPLGKKIKTKEGEGKVVERMILEQAVKVKIADEKEIKIKANDL